MNRLMAIKVNGRNSKAPHLQEILTKYGCLIMTRVGFHESGEGDKCSVDGIILLQLKGKEDEIDSLYKDITGLEGITAKFIEF
ncbi:hypothetical protein J2Z76_003038 [Sedimentibacter acidaminivorans]|jgi:hypothetical protein|uniref:Iron-only hydrogenase system regulator n=1 Tax=Sedimentibacter acidaminivorans TaxID=913099 RepID=A0ABS4GIH2_9FIRM|nr:hypothetical protein [Sedimentibacter acidaminivorans]MBP1927165.1 hypothetical protein [Sedimentibacter acidaminivorans]